MNKQICLYITTDRLKITLLITTNHIVNNIRVHNM